MASKTSHLRRGPVCTATGISAGIRWGSSLKRVFDVGLALAGLLVSAPLWVVITLAIWFESGRPILIVQERCGKDGKPFRSLKFRSMVTNAGQFNIVEDVENDPRITKAGRILRDTALDELPQLLNILKGDMSFVGPRALYPVIEDRENVKYRRLEEVPGFEIRSLVRPGLTGIAQIYAQKEISRRHKFKYDLLYIKKQSLWLDLKLIGLSFWITFRGQWESRGKKF